MRLTVATEDGDTYTVDVAPEMELENVLALLEADVSVPPEQLVRPWQFMHGLGPRTTRAVGVSSVCLRLGLTIEMRTIAYLSPPQTGIPVDEQLLFSSGKQMIGKQDTLAVSPMPSLANAGSSSVLILRSGGNSHMMSRRTTSFCCDGSQRKAPQLQLRDGE
jgi:hypothetical protein